MEAGGDFVVAHRVHGGQAKADKNDHQEERDNQFFAKAIRTGGADSKNGGRAKDAFWARMK